MPNFEVSNSKQLNIFVNGYLNFYDKATNSFVICYNSINSQ